ncbi:MAG: hypothetical protein DME96_13215 [Verrucomicrobia bacterium]|nr:MAG: hypothetical protein DME96_13215 [Verrucomicrobiota bacterium]
MAAPEENLPAAPPIERGGRTLQPHRIAVGDAEHGKERGEGVSHQGRIEAREIARSDDNQQS